MGAFTTSLSDEHQIIVEILDSIRLLIQERERIDANRADLKNALRALKILLDVHHEKEEDLLFPHLHRCPQLNEGGPKCGLYMTHLLNDNIGRSFIESGKHFASAPESAEIAAIREANSPLMIPIEEHRGGHIAIQWADQILDGAIDIANLQFILARFDWMMRLHIEKEDTCLFVVANHLLEPKIQDPLTERALAIDLRQKSRLQEAADVRHELAQKFPRDFTS
jgi:hemerythrin-like domain-containing protein